jgi:hypothetical protein
MRRLTTTVLLALVAAVAVTLASARSGADDAKKADAKVDNKLVGSWQLVSAKWGGREVPVGEEVTRIKHVTPTQFMWVAYDKNRSVVAGLGGDYTLRGDKYEEIPEYSVGDFKELNGKPQSFTWRVEGNKWYHDGKLSSGLTIEEVWERVEKKKRDD